MRRGVKIIRAGWKGQIGSLGLLWKIGPFFSLFYSCEKWPSIFIKKVPVRAYAATCKLKKVSKRIYATSRRLKISIILGQSFAPSCVHYVVPALKVWKKKRIESRNFTSVEFKSCWIVVLSKNLKRSVCEKFEERLFENLLNNDFLGRQHQIHQGMPWFKIQENWGRPCRCKIF